MGFIYEILSTSIVDIYVGQTLDPIAKRWDEHKTNAKNIIRYNNKDPTFNSNTKYFRNIRNSLLYNTIADHGIETFSIIMLEECA